MNAYVEIDWEDIERGDSIRVENKRRVEGLAFSIEYVASYDGFNWYEDSSYGHTYYLLERPTPPVILPTVPTLGWATTKWGSGHLVTLRNGWASPVREGHSHTVEFITAFTEAVAVPKSALDELRAAAGNMFPDGPTRNFLAAVDNASTR